MKKIILVLALLIPIGIFIFLKFFGKNEFSIPVYYESGVVNPPAVCNRKYDSPYQVSEALLKNVGWNGKPVLIIADSSSAIQKGINRLDEELSAEMQVIFLTGNDAFLNEFYECDLLLQPPWNTVLIDNQRRIRGYYDPKIREEIDRLEVELKILLKQY